MSANTYSPFVQLERAIESGTVMQILRSARHNGALALVCSMGNQRHVYASALENEFSADSRVDIGCIIKNFTALLTAVAVSEGHLALEDWVGRFFPEINGIDDSLMVCHLLNHSHGLDSTALLRSPFDPDGWIDFMGLWEGLTHSPSISPPGSMFYQHGIVGFWLAAAIVERIYEAKFGTLVEEWILPLIDVQPRASGGERICPAFGGLMLSANELTNLGNLHMESSGNASLDRVIRDLRVTHKVDVPPWPPVAEGATPGWFAYPGGTFGMFGRSEIGASFLLISPDDGASLAITGSGEHVITLVRRALIGSLVGEQEPRPPRPLTRAERSSKTFHQIAGRYGKAKIVLDVQCSPEGEIIVSIYDRQSAEHEVREPPRVSRRLIPGIDNTYFPTPPERRNIPFIRFVGEDANGLFEYALTGKHILRRIAR